MATFEQQEAEYQTEIDKSNKLQQLISMPGWAILEAEFDRMLKKLDSIESAETPEQFYANKSAKKMLKQFFGSIQSMVDNGREAAELLDKYKTQD